MGELAQSMAADGQAGKKIGEDEDAEDQIQLFYRLAARGERGRNNEKYRYDVKGYQRVAKAVGRWGVGCIVVTQRLDDACALSPLSGHVSYRQVAYKRAGKLFIQQLGLPLQPAGTRYIALGLNSGPAQTLPSRDQLQFCGCL